MVKIPAGNDPQQLAAAAAAWLRSDHVEQLRQQHGLHAGLGSPARLTTVLPHKVTAVTPEVTTFSNSTAGCWKRESAAAAAAAAAAGSSTDSSKNHTLDMAVELSTTAAATVDQPRTISETEPQLVLIIVITVTGSATIGAAAAAAIAWQWRKKRQLRDRTASKGGSSSNSSSGASRRRKRTRGIVKRHSKYLPAGCNMPPGSDARALLPALAAAAAAGDPALAQQLSGSPSTGQQQQQECEEAAADLATATAAARETVGATSVGAIAAHQGSNSSSSSSGGGGSVLLSIAALQQQLSSSSSLQPSRLVLPTHSALFHTHSAPVASAAAAVQQVAQVSTVIILQQQGALIQPAAAAAVQPVSRLRRYWSYAQGISGQISIGSSHLSGSSAVVISRSDLCSDSVSSAVRLDLQQQQQEGPALSRSSSRSTRSTISSSSIGEHDELGPQNMLEPGPFLQHYCSSSGGSSADGGSSSRGQVLAFAASLDHTGVGISPFQSHYNFRALSADAPELDNSS